MNEDWSAETGIGAGTGAGTGTGSEAEADLAGRLAGDLGAFDVGAAPIGPVMGWGKSMKTRRRAAQAGVLSAVAVAGVVLPFTLGSRPVAPPPPWTNHPATAPHKVSVDPPRSAADGTPVWSGAIDGVPWSDQPEPESKSDICLNGFTLCIDPGLYSDVTGTASSAGNVSESSFDEYLVVMDPKATGADVYLDDGTDLRLQPELYKGLHLAVFRVPHGYPIDYVVARLPSGDRTSVALNPPGGAATWGVWYPAGSVPEVPTTSGVVASRTNHDTGFWSMNVTAYVGPFGVYIAMGPLSYGPAQPHLWDGLDLDGAVSTIKAGQTSRWVANPVSDTVDHIVLEFPDGTHQVVTPVEVGGFRFAAAYMQADRLPLRAVSYNAAGAVLSVSDDTHGPAEAATPSTP